MTSEFKLQLNNWPFGLFIGLHCISFRVLTWKFKLFRRHAGTLQTQRWTTCSCRDPTPKHRARHTGALTLDPEFTRRHAHELAAIGQLPDTLWTGAWLLLQSRWLGSLWPVLHEATGPQPLHAATTMAFDATRPARAWLAELDQGRRAAFSVATRAGVQPVALWLRDGAAAAGTTSARLCLWLDSRPAPKASTSTSRRT
ncbi:hypothetical protein [Variovorax sp. E3]|uniref:hypothetical protein n=1 Tax=Variovorax sp. E3 TaxID=1914993 RepID=UPI0022B68088|nr:hypothetical protein [Variovorax sp. E3]